MTLLPHEHTPTHSTVNSAFSFGVIGIDKKTTAVHYSFKEQRIIFKGVCNLFRGVLAPLSSHLRHKQHAVGGYCADKNGPSHSAVDQVGPGLQENGNGYSHSRGDGNQCDNCQDGGRLVDWRVADVTGQSSQIGPVEKETTLWWQKNI